MPKTTDAQRGALASAEDAIELGYEIGRSLRDNGAGKSREAAHMKAWPRDHHAGPYLALWQAGFRAGYRGQPKPSARE
jgi:hypothetical protein